MSLSYNLITPPVVEPISLYEAKLQCGFGPMESSDRAKEQILAAQLRPFISAARSTAELYMNRAIYNSTWQRTLDHFPLWWEANGTVNPSYRKDWPYYSDFWNRIRIDVPMPRTQSVSSITYVDQSGEMQTLDPSQYIVDLTSEPARIVPALGTYWPSEMTYIPGSVVLTFVAGSYGDGVEVDTCPATIKAAIKMIVARLYQMGAPEPLELELIPKGAVALLDFHAIYVATYLP
jgi:uncharacterized phiE125 gp8 family phage protein